MLKYSGIEETVIADDNITCYFYQSFFFNKSRFEFFFICDMHFLAQLPFILQTNQQDLLQKS